jgi:hypothetical protein
VVRAYTNAARLSRRSATETRFMSPADKWRIWVPQVGMQGLHAVTCRGAENVGQDVVRHPARARHHALAKDVAPGSPIRVCW